MKPETQEQQDDHAGRLENMIKATLNGEHKDPAVIYALIKVAIELSGGNHLFVADACNEVGVFGVDKGMGEK